jgi:hypothetical protein
MDELDGAKKRSFLSDLPVILKVRCTIYNFYTFTAFLHTRTNVLHESTSI